MQPQRHEDFGNYAGINRVQFPYILVEYRQAIMFYMVPASTPPKEDQLTSDDVSFLQNHMDVTNYEILVDGQGIAWDKIDELEVAVAARQKSPAGWLVKNVIYGGQERYHVGIYSGRTEAVLPNLSLQAAKYVVQTIAYHARTSIRYTGPEGITPISES